MSVDQITQEFAHKLRGMQNPSDVNVQQDFKLFAKIHHHRAAEAIVNNLLNKIISVLVLCNLLTGIGDTQEESHHYPRCNRQKRLGQVSFRLLNLKVHERI